MARLNHASVVSAAAQVANTHGLDALSLGALAKHVGVKPPSLYNHIDNLASLKRDLALESLKQLKERFQTAAIGKAGADALRSLAYAYRDFARGNPGLFSATLRTVEDQDAELKAAGQDVLNIFLVIFASFGLGQNDIIHAIRVFRAGLTGFVVLEQNEGFGLPVDADESFERLLELHLEAV